MNQTTTPPPTQARGRPPQSPGPAPRSLLTDLMSPGVPSTPGRAVGVAILDLVLVTAILTVAHVVLQPVTWAWGLLGVLAVYDGVRIALAVRRARQGPTAPTSDASDAQRSWGTW